MFISVKIIDTYLDAEDWKVRQENNFSGPEVFFS